MAEAAIKEEFCEWHSLTPFNDEWTPSCQPNSTFTVCGVAWFNYCPYCSKPLKVRSLDSSKGAHNEVKMMTKEFNLTDDDLLRMAHYANLPR